MEHPVDAAARGVHRGPPVAHPPSPWFTWGLRIALLLPLSLAVAKGAPTLLATSQPAGDTVAAGLLVLVLAVSVVMVWFSAGWTRLSSGEANRVRGELGPQRYRRLRRMVWRRGPLPDQLTAPPESSADGIPAGVSAGVPVGVSTEARGHHDEAALRPWVEAYVHQQLAGAPTAGLIYAVGAANVLGTIAPGSPPGSTVGVLGAVLTGVLVLGTVVGGGALVWLRGRGRAAARSADRS